MEFSGFNRPGGILSRNVHQFSLIDREDGPNVARWVRYRRTRTNPHNPRPGPVLVDSRVKSGKYPDDMSARSPLNEMYFVEHDDRNRSCKETSICFVAKRITQAASQRVYVRDQDVWGAYAVEIG